LSQGKLDGLADYVVSFAGGDYQLAWDESKLGVYGAATDKVSVFALLGTTDEAGKNSVEYKYLGETTRGIGAFTVDPGDLAPEISEVVGTRFVACVSRLDGTMVSNSQAVHDGM